ncbi:MAG: hypothetical protein IJU57_00265, partial [Clostridia bacterium]|nr:hypothetical protein [Clostridia bacterium]
MDNQRKKKVTGKAGSIKKRGEGLNTGPVGKADAYAERKEQQAQRENAQKTPQNQSMPFHSPQNIQQHNSQQNTQQNTAQGAGGNVQRSGGIGKSPIIIIIIVIAAVFLI